MLFRSGVSGGAPPATQTGSAVSSVTLNDNTLNLAGYTFAGWATSNGSTTIVYLDKGSVAITSNLTLDLFPVWAAIGSKTVTFNPNYASGPGVVTQLNNVAANLNANTFTRAGFVFTGWNSQAGGGGTSYADQAPYTFASDITLFAQWSGNTLAITYNSNGGSAPAGGAASTVSGGTVSSLPANPTRDGYTFNGWFTANSGGSQINTTNPHNQTADFTLYAQWTLIVVNVDPTPPAPTPKLKEEEKKEEKEPKKEPEIIKLPQYTPKPLPVGTNKATGNVTTTSTKPARVEIPTITAQAPVEIKSEVKQDLTKKVEILPTNGALEVKPVDGWTGKIQVPVVTVVDGKETEVFTDIVVNPEKPEEGKYLPVKTILETKINWQAPPSQVVQYVVKLNGETVCQTAKTTCKVPDAVGPKSVIEVTAVGNDNTKSDVALPAYTPEKPVPALVVNFTENSSRLSSKGTSELERIARIIEREGFTRLVVFGHTDNQGGQKNAAELSLARAKATKAFLDKRLPNVTFVLAGKGLDYPVASNATEKGRAANRRAELKVW